MLRPLIQRLTLSAILLATIRGTGAAVDLAAAARDTVAATEPTAEPAPPETRALKEAARAATERRQPDRRWPFFSFATGGKRSW